MDARKIFEILVREHAGMLMVYLRAIVRDPATVDDLFQETMLTAWRKLNEFDQKRPFAPWLRGIAAKLILVERRKRAAGAILCDEFTLEHLDHRLQRIALQTGDTWDEKLDALRECLRELPEPYHEAVRLRYHEGLSPAGLAERLQLSTREAVARRGDERGSEFVIE